MIVSPRKLRNCTDTLGLILGAATMACALSAVGIAGYWERIMSGYSKQLICGIALGATTLAYHLSSCVFLFLSSCHLPLFTCFGPSTDPRQVSSHSRKAQLALHVPAHLDTLT